MPSSDTLGNTSASLARFGIERNPVLSAVRAKCLDCAGTWLEVERCECANCPLWPFRFGRDPWRRRRELTSEQRRQAVERPRGARPA